MSAPENAIQKLPLSSPFRLESGVILKDGAIAYQTFGKISPNKDNVIWIFHALTANSNPLDWWPGLVGEGCLFNPEEHFIICANMLGSCYGSTGAADINPDSGRKYGIDFPEITVGDIVSTLRQLQHHLGVERIKCGIGGSMGGQQLLEWAVRDPDLFDLIIPVATNARHSPWGIAFNTAQRMALESDRTFYEYTENAGKTGLKAARAIGMLSYRNMDTFNQTQQDQLTQTSHFAAESYQRYQGEKLARRFDAHSYYALSKAMDSHHIGRNFDSLPNALREIRSNVLAIGIKSDILFPPQEQEYIASHTPNGRFIMIESLYGHDGFLIEVEKLTRIISPVLNH